MRTVRQRYQGQTRQLVIALDVGTTFSGASYSILEPGEIPSIHWVNEYPGQEHLVGHFKIPSVVIYDSDAVVKAAGAEATLPNAVNDAVDHDWLTVKWFKMHLCPKPMLHRAGHSDCLPPLPPGKSAVEVFGDFLRYLNECVRGYIEKKHHDGPALWAQCEQEAHYVLSHPNGWTGVQQNRMRRSAVYAGLISDSPAGQNCLALVTEGEASLHSCLSHGLAGDLQVGDCVCIADMGGGTLDFSSYHVTSVAPLQVEETATPACVLQGSIFVTMRAKELLSSKLANSRWGSSEYIEYITRQFDASTKLHFRDPAETQIVDIGSPLARNPGLGIRNGQLSLSGQELQSLFEPAISEAERSIKAQVAESCILIKTVFLVGGFAASPWLLQSLRSQLALSAINVFRPDSNTSKAVAEGALMFHLDNLVTVRVSRLCYGTRVFGAYDPLSPEHQSNLHKLTTHSISGDEGFMNMFHPLLLKGERVSKSTETRTPLVFYRSVTDLDGPVVSDIYAYDGGEERPLWLQEDSGHFRKLFSVFSDKNINAFTKKRANHRVFEECCFEIIFFFGLTEVKAQIVWKEKDVEKRGPVEICYDADE